jgi:undecaprenyl-diphosphatase
MVQPFLDAILLGIVQGITEFFPISSEGHLALAELLFKVEEGSLTFNVLLHAGTLVATLIVLRERVGRAVAGGVAALARPSRFVSTAGGRDAVTVILASIPTALLGLLLRERVTAWTRSPLVLGLGFVGSSAWILSTYWLKPGAKEQPTWLGALFIGLAQGLAVLPGLSRSAGTIASAMWLGVRPERAFELSFLMSLPAVLGAILLEGRLALGHPFPLTSALLGTFVALLIGIGALLLLRQVVIRGRFVAFALWTVPIAIATLAMAAVWPHRA